MKRCLILLGVLVVHGCDDGPTEPGASCDTSALPLSGAPAGPTLVAAILDVQSTVIPLLLTATDPQGSADLIDVQQTASVFRDTRCTASPIVLEDDLAGSGVEESFGTAVSSETDAALYAEIAAATTWPIEIDFQDRAGNRTTGRVMATVRRD